jgi:hypothetical protein
MTFDDEDSRRSGFLERRELSSNVLLSNDLKEGDT